MRFSTQVVSFLLALPLVYAAPVATQAGVQARHYGPYGDVSHPANGRVTFMDRTTEHKARDLSDASAALERRDDIPESAIEAREQHDHEHIHWLPEGHSSQSEEGGEHSMPHLHYGTIVHRKVSEKTKEGWHKFTHGLGQAWSKVVEPVLGVASKIPV